MLVDVGMGLRRLRIAVVTAATLAVCVPALPARAGDARLIGATGRFELRYANAVARGADGRVYVLDTSGRSPDPKVLVSVYSPSGRGLYRWRVAASDDIYDLAVDGADNVYVTVRSARKILKYTATGRPLGELHVPGAGNGFVDMSLALDPAGRLLVAEGDGLLVVFDAAGHVVSQRELIAPGDRATNGLYGIAVTRSGRVYVSDARGIAQVDLAGGASRYIARTGRRPQDVAASALAAGPADTLYVLNRSAPIARIQRYAADGSYLGSAGLDRHYEWADLASAGDARILAVQWSSGIGDGAVRVLAPIATLDVTAPTITIRSLLTRPSGRASRITARLRYSLSEPAAVRLTFARREERGGHRGRDRQTQTVDVPRAPAGTHTFDWTAPTAKLARRRRGSYKVFAVAWDGAGLQSGTARASFALARR